MRCYSPMITCTAKAIRMARAVTSAIAIRARVLTGLNVSALLAHGPRDRLGGMTRSRPRVGIVLMAGLTSLGILAGCASVDVSVTRETTATTSSAEAPTATQAASAPATTSGGAGTGAADEPAVTAAEETREQILLLDGALLDGQQFDFAATAGNDVLLWFWAPW